MSDLNSRVNRAVWFDIPVADLARAARFYRAVMKIGVEEVAAGPYRFCVLEHADGNGGCLVPNAAEVTSSGGILLYLNAEGRIRDAVAQATAHGGKVVEAIKAIGPHGFRAVILDSEGNRLALHSSTDA